MNIRLATDSDYDVMWGIFQEVIQTGDTYSFAADTPRSDFRQYWSAPAMRTFVAESDHEILGMYYIRPNDIDRGGHIANCAYMIKSIARGKGIGGLLCEHSIQQAEEMKFIGIQFNKVVSTNKAAIKLWEKHGFRIIGTTPNGFDHKEFGLVDTHIMYKAL